MLPHRPKKSIHLSARQWSEGLINKFSYRLWVLRVEMGGTIPVIDDAVLRGDSSIDQRILLQI